jgi:hypothetical protein
VIILAVAGHSPSNDTLGQILAEIRSQAAGKSLEQAGERLTTQTNHIAKLRLEFFDRLVLLDGGTISLSLTLIGLLPKSEKAMTTHWHAALFISWACFTMSLVFAMMRNWREHDRLMATETAGYALVVHEWFSAFANQVESLGVSTADSPAKDVLAQGPALVTKQQKQSESLNKTTKLLGAAAMILTVVGYLLLLGFAIKNTAKWL